MANLNHIAMKRSILNLALALMLGSSLSARAGLYSYGGSAYNIPDGSRGGVFSQVSVSGELSSLTDITLT